MELILNGYARLDLSDLRLAHYHELGIDVELDALRYRAAGRFEVLYPGLEADTVRRPHADSLHHMAHMIITWSTHK